MPSCNCKQCGDKCEVFGRVAELNAIIRDEIADRESLVIAKVVKWLRCFSTRSSYVEDTTATAYAQVFADKIESGEWHEDVETQPAIHKSDFKSVMKNADHEDAAEE